MSKDANKEVARLLKLYALAMRGEGGEADNARAMLDKLLKKAGMTFAELEREAEAEKDGGKREWVAFTLPKFEKGAPTVLAQLVFSFGLRRGDDAVSFRPDYASMRKRGVDVFVLLSPAETALFHLFARPCILAYNSSIGRLKNRQKEERLEMKERHQDEMDDAVVAFCALNRLVSPKSMEQKREDGKEKQEREYRINWKDIEQFEHEHDKLIGEDCPKLEEKGGNIA